MRSRSQASVRQSIDDRNHQDVTEEPSMTTAPAFVRAANPPHPPLARPRPARGPERGLDRTRPDQRAPAVGAGGDRRARRPALVIGAYGDVQWVRNLRAAGEGEIPVGGRTETVSARELDRTEATDFYARVLPAMVSRLPWFGRLFARVLFTAAAPGGSR